MKEKRNLCVDVRVCVSFHLTHTFTSSYDLPNVRPRCHHLAAAVRCDCSVCVSADMVSNRWSNLIHASFLPRCPLALTVRWWCYLGLTGILSALFLEGDGLAPLSSAPPPALGHTAVPPQRGCWVDQVLGYQVAPDKSAPPTAAYCLQSFLILGVGQFAYSWLDPVAAWKRLSFFCWLCGWSAFQNWSYPILIFFTICHVTVTLCGGHRVLFWWNDTMKFFCRSSCHFSVKCQDSGVQSSLKTRQQISNLSWQSRQRLQSHRCFLFRRSPRPCVGRFCFASILFLFLRHGLNTIRWEIWNVWDIVLWLSIASNFSERFHCEG